MHRLTTNDLASLVRGYTVRAEWCEDYGTRECNVNDAYWLNLAVDLRAAAERWQAVYEASIEDEAELAGVANTFEETAR